MTRVRGKHKKKKKKKGCGGVWSGDGVGFGVKCDDVDASKGGEGEVGVEIPGRDALHIVQ